MLPCVKVMVAVWSLGVAVREVGALGTVESVVMLLLALEALEVAPPAFVAVTVKVYAVFGSSPVTDIGEVDPVAVIPPGLEVTV